MHKRMTLLTATLACVLMGALAFAMAACGSGDAVTTTAPAVTATTAPAGTDTTAATPGTAAGGNFTIPSLQMTPDVQTYLGELMTAMGSLQSLPDVSNPLTMDPATVTDAQIASAEAALTEMQKAVDALKTISPPDALKTMHESLVGLITSTKDIGSDAIDALKSNDQTALAAAKAESDKLNEQINAFFTALVPLMTGGTPTS